MKQFILILFYDTQICTLSQHPFVDTFLIVLPISVEMVAFFFKLIGEYR